MDDDSVPIPPYTECVATDQYIKEYPDELSFGIGDVLIILEPSEVRYWYIAENANHERGIVPVTFLKRDVTCTFVIDGVSHEPTATKPPTLKPRKPPIPPKSKPVTSISPLTLLSSCIPDSHTNPSSTQDLLHNGLVIPSDHHNLVPNANTTGLTQPTLHCSAAMKELPPDIAPSKFPCTPSKIPPTPFKVPSTPSKIPPTPSKVPSTPSKVPSTPSKIPPTPSKVPSTPSKVPSTPSKVPPTPSKVPSTPSKVPPTPSKVPSTPSKVPSTPSKVPPTPSKVPSTPSKVPSTPSKVPSTPSKTPPTPSKVSNILTSPLLVHTPKQYSSVEDFRAKSGWFRPSVERVLMDKLQLSLQAFTGFTQGTYFFQHKWEPNLKYVGWSHDIHCELIQLFQGLYDKSEVSLNPLEAALRFRQPDAPSWSIRAWRVENTEELDMEAVKLMIEYRTLPPCGMNKEARLVSTSQWEAFCVWYSQQRK